MTSPSGRTPATAITLVLASFATNAMAQAQPQTQQSQDHGFSYFMGLGMLSSHYEERARSIGVRSSASARSALLMTGALYAPTTDLLLSLDNATTFAPGTSTETWHGTGASLPDTALQRNRFSLSQSTTRMQLYQRMRGDWFWLAGGAFRSQTFKRYGVEVLRPDLVDAPEQNVVDESASELLAQVGIAWETAQVKGSPVHHGLKATWGLPVWRRVESTNFLDARFHGTRGWDLGLEGRYSIALHHNAHIGLWGQYQLSRRGSQIKDAMELPRMNLRSVSLGVELLWKL